MTLLCADGAWCWFQDPRAIFYNGKTFYGSVDSEGDIEVRRYNHSTGTVDQAVNLKDNFNVDDHAAPSLHLTPNGKITVFFSAHNGPEMKFRTTANAGDLSTWGTSGLTVPTQGGDHDYPNPIYLSGESGGKSFLFWRGEAEHQTLITSTNLGTASTPTWTTPRNFYITGFRRPYFKYASDGDTKIHMFASKSHPVNVSHNSLVHFYYEAGYFYKSDGTVIKSVTAAASNPFDHLDCTTVYDAVANDNQAWNWDIALDSEGNPVVAFVTMETDMTDHRAHISKWNGTSWVDQELCGIGECITGIPSFYSTGLYLDHNDPNIAYVSKGLTSTTAQIEKWVDSGSGYVQDSILTPSPIEKNVRPVTVRNHDGTVPVMWMKGDYDYFKPFQGMMYDTGIYNS